MAGQNQTPNTDIFDAYFWRADLDGDGRISGAEAVAFFQGSNLPKQVLAQVWMLADQNRTGYLGRAEFYNALKLVTVAQSKRELTPDIVKAALYGPAAAKIPAPQINIAATPAPQLNSKVAAPVTQLSGATLAASQNIGIRGSPVLTSASMNQEYFPSQQNQFTRLPQAVPSGTAFHPHQTAASQGMPGGGTMAAPHPPNPNVSTDWLGGRTGGPPVGVTSQAPTRGISPSTIQEGFGMLTSTQPRPQAMMMPSAIPKAQDPALPSYLVANKDSKALTISGNGFDSDSVFGDVFSATPSQPKQDSSAPTVSAGSFPVSSAAVPVSSGPQPSVKPSPLESLQSTFNQQSMGGQFQQVRSTVKQNQQVSAQNSAAFTLTGVPVGAGNSASSQSQVPWPRMTQSNVQKYSKVFVEVDTDRDGKITGEQARNLFLSWRLPRGQPTAAYGNAIWGSASGLQQPQGMTGPRPIMPAAGVRSPTHVSVPPQTDEAMQPSQQKSRVPVLEKHLANQLSKEEQSSLNAKFQEASEAEKKVEELEKEILDSKEKIEFYRTKMQELEFAQSYAGEKLFSWNIDKLGVGLASHLGSRPKYKSVLILYKSRCDNRLNEIMERASTDKREAESLAKKYEEKYKQVGDVASKLTIEEATFRDIQDRKMELYQAIVKMEQGGSTDGILQVRADCIQSDLDELVKALNGHCKKYGLHVKPTALVELPYGWQPGIQEGAADWDEDWDKFEDEGFTFVKEVTLDVQNAIAPPRPNSSSVQKETTSADEGLTAASSSNGDGKLEKPSTTGERIPENEMPYAQSEDGWARSPPDSPAGRSALESPSQEFQNPQFRKSIGADGSPHAKDNQSDHGGAESVFSVDKSFDEPSWGAFDTHYDTESVWGFNPVSVKDLEDERHSENSFFGSSDFGLNPIRTESPHTDNMSRKKSPFTFADSVPSTPIFNSGNSPPRYSEGSEDHSFDNFSRFDSFSMHDSGFFAPRDSFARFDSIRSTTDSDHGCRFPSFDDKDPFGSTGPFKTSMASQTPRRVSDNWSAF